MKKTIKIGNQEVELVSTALTSIAYKRLFNDDILTSLGVLHAGTKEGAVAADTVEDMMKLAYVMHKQATVSVKELLSLDEIDYYEWINNFDRTDFYAADVITSVISVWSGNLATSVESKNVEGAQQDH